MYKSRKSIIKLALLMAFFLLLVLLAAKGLCEVDHAKHFEKEIEKVFSDDKDLAKKIIHYIDIVPSSHMSRAHASRLLVDSGQSRNVGVARCFGAPFPNRLRHVLGLVIRNYKPRGCRSSCGPCLYGEFKCPICPRCNECGPCPVPDYCKPPGPDQKCPDPPKCVSCYGAAPEDARPPLDSPNGASPKDDGMNRTLVDHPGASSSAAKHFVTHVSRNKHKKRPHNHHRHRAHHAHSAKSKTNSKTHGSHTKTKKRDTDYATTTTTTGEPPSSSKKPTSKPAADSDGKTSTTSTGKPTIDGDGSLKGKHSSSNKSESKTASKSSMISGKHQFMMKKSTSKTTSFSVGVDLFEMNLNDMIKNETLREQVRKIIDLIPETAGGEEMALARNVLGKFGEKVDTLPKKKGVSRSFTYRTSRCNVRGIIGHVWEHIKRKNCHCESCPPGPNCYCKLEICPPKKQCPPCPKDPPCPAPPGCKPFPPCPICPPVGGNGTIPKPPPGGPDGNGTIPMPPPLPGPGPGPGGNSTIPKPPPGGPDGNGTVPKPPPLPGPGPGPGGNSTIPKPPPGGPDGNGTVPKPPPPPGPGDGDDDDVEPAPKPPPGGPGGNGTIPKPPPGGPGGNGTIPKPPPGGPGGNGTIPKPPPGGPGGNGTVPNPPTVGNGTKPGGGNGTDTDDEPYFGNESIVKPSDFDESIDETFNDTDPNDPLTETEARARKKCIGFGCENEKSCGVADLNRLTPKGSQTGYMNGGEPQKYGEWPSFVRLTMTLPTPPGGNGLCGGVLISNRHVLTAGHCIQMPLEPKQESPNILKPDAFKVIIGDHKRTRKDEFEVERSVESICLSKKFSDPFGEGSRYDYAVLTLDKNVTFNEHVQPACLPYKPFLLEKTKCYVIGIGIIRFDNENYQHTYADTVQKMPVRRVSCKDWGIQANDRSRFCFTKANARGDTCGGDSGGPILCINRARRWTVIGLVSYGSERCDGTEAVKWTGVYTRIPGIIDQIGADCM